MRKLMITVLIAVSTLAMAGQSETRTFEINGNASLRLSNISGDIQISQGNGGEIEVTYTLKDERITVEMEQDGNRVDVRTKYPNNTRNIEGGVEYNVRVPANCDLEINSVSGSITAKGANGRIELHSVSGSISGSDLGGNIEANSVSGKVTLKNIDASDVDANSTSGSIVYEGTMGGRNYEFNSVSGSITLKVSDANFEVSGNTLSGGVDVDGFDNITINKAKYGPNTSLKGSEGNGDAELSLNTVSGSITIKRR